MGGNCRPSVAKQSMELYDGLLFSSREFSSLYVWPEVVRPPQSAAFATAQKTSFLRESTPAAMPIFLDVGCQLFILLCGPGAFLEADFVATGGASHYGFRVWRDEFRFSGQPLVDLPEIFV